MKKLYAIVLMWLLIGRSFAQVLVNETFENGNADGQPPVGWICTDGGWKCGYQEKNRNCIPHEGDWCVYSICNTDTWMYKEINVTAGNYYLVSFWHIILGNKCFDFEVKAGSSPMSSAMTIMVVPQMLVNNNLYVQTIGVFQATTTGFVYVGFHSVDDNSQCYMLIDDLVIEQIQESNLEDELDTKGKTAYYDKNYTQAVNWFRKSAELGYSSGQNNLGYMYKEGYGVDKDYIEAIKWFRKSAEQGNSYGIGNLGDMYFEGLGVETNYMEAIKCYKKSEELGNAKASAFLGFMYENGYGVEQNYFEAFRFYRKSAEQGYGWGQYKLGWMYENGIGVAKNKKEAFYWYELAAARGDKDAKQRMEELKRSY